MSRRADEREAEKAARLEELRGMTAADHVREAEELIERGERQAMAPAASSCYNAAAAHAALAQVKAAGYVRT